jgi:glucosyl-dolichyl phosphate glucuronosyltransferase
VAGLALPTVHPPDAVKVSTVSVVICTYNRGARLARTLAYFSALAPTRDFDADVIVVDNNSTDRTADIVQEAASRSRTPIRYLRETRQGKSFALNAGLSVARGDVLALTDDDVEPAPDWLERIVEAFQTAGVVFVGGKVLPAWEAPPPAWLLTKRAQDIWGPLALLDYGDQRFFFTSDAGLQRRPIGANLAIRRDVMVRLGGWRTDLGKVNNTLISGEDHEIYFRLRRAGECRGVYDPRITVVHDVPASRVRAAYFRRWFFAAGRTRALMIRDFYHHLDFEVVPHVAGVPRFLYRELARQAGRYVRAIAGDPVDRFIQELTLIRLAGLMWHQWTRPAGDPPDQSAARPILSPPIR